MTIGSTLKEGLQHRGYEQIELALETNYSIQSANAWVNDRRKIPNETLPKVNEILDYPEFYLESAMVATNGVSLPVLDGDYIERNRTSMKDLVQVETNEALEKLEEVQIFKPPKFTSEMDKQEVKEVIKELLDAACSIINMVAVLCKEYKFSMKDIYRSWIITLKARRLRK